MSVVKSPQEKKRLSLLNDCRNIYGENAKASRKNIRRSKQGLQRMCRRLSRQYLSQASRCDNDAGYIDLQNKINTATRLKRKQGFKKWPDLPLGEILHRKRTHPEK